MVGVLASGLIEKSSFSCLCTRAIAIGDGKLSYQRTCYGGTFWLLEREEKFPMAVGVGRLTKNCRVYYGTRQPHYRSRELPRGRGIVSATQE